MPFFFKILRKIKGMVYQPENPTGIPEDCAPVSFPTLAGPVPATVWDNHNIH